jgi:uncharacterized protein YcnI
MRRQLGRAGVVVGAAAVVILTVAGPAAAHVTVTSSNAVQGGDAVVAFHVPDEEDTATTVKVEVNLPTDTPIGSVAVRPLAGWTATTQTTKLATPVTTDDGPVSTVVSKITWTAGTGAAITFGQYQDFEVSLGSLPNTGQLVFKTLQYYSDGTIVRWIDLPNPGGPEPEHPAPVLTLAKPASSSAAAPATSSGSGSGSGLTTVALVLSALSLIGTATIAVLLYRAPGVFGLGSAPAAATTRPGRPAPPSKARR